MKSHLIAVAAILIGCCSSVVFGELDVEVRDCLAEYKAAVNKADIPADVLEFITSADASGPPPRGGCSQMYALSERFLDEVPCATELIYMDEDILNDLKRDPKVDQFYQAATACAFSQYGSFDNNNNEDDQDDDQDDDDDDEHHE